MLNEKLNLYNPEWLELVFSGKNKQYGAYELRQNYNRTMAKAMGIAFTVVISASCIFTFAGGHTKNVQPPSTKDSMITVVIPPVQPHRQEVKQAKPVEPAATAAPRSPAAPSIKYTIPHIVPGEVDENPPKIDDMAGKEVSNVTSEGKGGQEQMADPTQGQAQGGAGTDPGVDVNKEYKSVEIMPEPEGGAAGWAKFLNKNLRYPSQAQEEGKSGRVIVSFVVERDGRLTDIVVTGKAGYGMDEEAIRVLKLAKPWKPGKQNGQPVRVRYSIPMNFQLTEQQ